MLCNVNCFPESREAEISKSQELQGESELPLHHWPHSWALGLVFDVIYRTPHEDFIYICIRHIYKLKAAHWILPGSQKGVLVDKINEVARIFCANNAIKQIVSYIPAKTSSFYRFFSLKYDAMIQWGGNAGGKIYDKIWIMKEKFKTPWHSSIEATSRGFKILGCQAQMLWSWNNLKLESKWFVLYSSSALFWLIRWGSLQLKSAGTKSPC